MATRGQIEAGRAVIVVDVQDKLNQNLKLVEQRLKKFANKIGQIGFDLFRGGLVGSIPVFGSLNEFMKFEDEILRLGTKLNATEAQLRSVEKTIRQLGKTTSFTALEVATGATSLAQAGLSPGEVQKGLQAVLDLGRGARITLDESADLLANTAKTFKIPVSSFGEIASQFIVAARLSTIEVSNLKESIKEVSGTLNDLNVDLPTSLALLNQLGFRSIKGTKAGTTLNTMLLNFVANSEKIAKFLNVDLQDSKGNIRKITDVIGEFGQKIQELKPARRARLSQFLFNIRGSRGETALRDIEAVVKMADQIKNAGNEAREAATKMDSGLGGSVRRATSAINDLAISLGQKLAPAVQYILDLVPALAASIDQIVQRAPIMTASILAIPPGILLAGTALLGLGFILNKVAGLLGIVTASVSGMITVLRNSGESVTKGLTSPFTGALAVARTVDKKLAATIFGSGRGRRKRPKSVLNATIPFAGPASFFVRQAKNLDKFSKTGFDKLLVTVPKLARVAWAIGKINVGMTGFLNLMVRLGSTTPKFILSIQRSIAVLTKYAAANAAARHQFRLLNNLINQENKLVIKATQLSAVRNKALVHQEKIRGKLAKAIVVERQKQAAYQKMLKAVNAKGGLAATKAYEYKRLVEIEKAYQAKLLEIQKQSARKQRLYGKPFLAKDSKELARLGKQRGDLLKRVGQVTPERAAYFSRLEQRAAAKSLVISKKISESQNKVFRLRTIASKQRAITSQVTGFANAGIAKKTAQAQAVQLQKALAAKNYAKAVKTGQAYGKLLSKGMNGELSKLGSRTGGLLKIGGKGLFRGFFGGISKLFSGAGSLLKIDYIKNLFNVIKTGGGILAGFFRGALSFGKFLFSFNGLFTVIQLLLLFGNKLDFTKKILDAFGRGFSAFGKALSRLATQSQAAFAQISSGLTLIFAGQGSAGVDALIGGFSNLASIITNNLLAGFNRFIQEISPGLDYIYVLFGTIWNLVKLIGTNIVNILAPLQEIGKVFQDGKSFSDSLSEIFTPDTVVKGGKLLGNLIEGLALSLTSLVQSGLSFLASAVDYLTRTISSFVKLLVDGYSELFVSPTDYGEQARLRVIYQTIRADGLLLAQGLKNTVAEMDNVPNQIRQASQNYNDALDNLANTTNFSAAANARAKAQESAARAAASRASFTAMFNNTISGLSTLGDSAIRLGQVTDELNFGMVQLTDTLSTFISGVGVNEELSMWENTINKLLGFVKGKATRNTTVKDVVQVAGDAAANALANPKAVIGGAVNLLGQAIKNPIATAAGLLQQPMADAAAAAGSAIGKLVAGEDTKQTAQMLGAVVGSFQETRGRLMAAKSEPEKQTELLKNISAGLHSGDGKSDPYLKQLVDKDTQQKFDP